MNRRQFLLGASAAATRLALPETSLIGEPGIGRTFALPPGTYAVDIETVDYADIERRVMAWVIQMHDRRITFKVPLTSPTGLRSE
jgi:hypothetical protein